MFDQNKFRKLADKSYRDGYMHTAVRGGIAYQIRALRERSGMTQAEFAQQIGTTQSVISRLESTEYGKVSVQTLLNVASAFDVALLLRFVSYPAFIDGMQSMNDNALCPENIQSTLSRDAAVIESNAVQGTKISYKALSPENDPMWSDPPLIPCRSVASYSNNNTVPRAAIAGNFPLAGSSPNHVGY